MIPLCRCNPTGRKYPTFWFGQESEPRCAVRQRRNAVDAVPMQAPEDRVRLRHHDLRFPRELIAQRNACCVEHINVCRVGFGEGCTVFREEDREGFRWVGPLNLHLLHFHERTEVYSQFRVAGQTKSKKRTDQI